MSLTLTDRERSSLARSYAPMSDAPRRPGAGCTAEAGEDACLVAAVLKGEAGAFDRLAERHAPAVASIARRFVRDPNDLDDVLQETFLRAYRTLDRFRGGASVRTWLIQIALNVCRDRRRTFWSRRVRLAEDALRCEPASSGDGFSGEVGLRQALHGAIAELPEKLLVPFVLHALEDLTGAEIAAVLCCSESTVWTRIYAARKRLRARLGDLLEA